MKLHQKKAKLNLVDLHRRQKWRAIPHILSFMAEIDTLALVRIFKSDSFEYLAL